MTELKFYGDRPPGIEGASLPGRLIVIGPTGAVEDADSPQSIGRPCRAQETNPPRIETTLR